MTQYRKTLTHYARDLEQWVAQGWLSGQETGRDLQDMAQLSDVILVETERRLGYPRPNVQAEIFGIKGRFHEVLVPLLRDAPDAPLLEVLQPILDDHPGMSAGMALYWLRRQSG
jgi:hypothetical protein